MRIASKISLRLALAIGAVGSIVAFGLWRAIAIDTSRELTSQQDAFTAAMASSFDDVLATHHSLIIAAAKAITPTMVDQRETIQRWLESRQDLEAIFDAHLFFFSAQGEIIAERPVVKERIGKSIAYRDYFKATVTTQAPHISDPFISSQEHRHPVVGMTAPVFDKDGRMIGVLAGGLDLLGTNFVQKFGQLGLSEDSNFSVITSKRVVVSHRDKRSIFTVIPPGVDPFLDRGIGGFNGTEVVSDAAGNESVVAIKHLKRAPWLIKFQTFPSAISGKEFGLLKPFPIAIMIAALILWVLSHLIVVGALKPLRSLASKVRARSLQEHRDEMHPLHALDEYHLFNSAFESEIKASEFIRAELREVTQVNKVLDAGTNEFVFWKDVNGNVMHVSDGAFQLTGYTPAEFIERPRLFDELVFKDDQGIWGQRIKNLGCSEWTSSLEIRIVSADGKTRWVSYACCPVTSETGEFQGFRESLRDIDHQRESDKKLRLAASVFYSARESIVVTDEVGRIEAVNPAFTLVTGFSEVEVIGETPRLLKSGKHSKSFYEDLWSLLIAQGSWQGEIWNRRKNGELYAANTHIEAVKDDSGKLLHYICGQIDVTRLRNVEDHMAFLISHDSLTGLLNRAAFENLGDPVLRNVTSTCNESTVMFVDLDGFKNVNESLGHAIGDAVLIAVAKRLQSLCRVTDLIARVGGDEFGILFPGLEFSQARNMAEKILVGLREPLSIESHKLSLSVSIGIAVQPRDGLSVGDLLKNADSALYQAKNDGRNTCVFYEASMSESTYGLLLMETELRQAIENNELVTYFQPQVCLKSKSILGAEALVRWIHPQRGMIQPGEFIPLAEQSGLISDLGQWVLKDVCKSLSRWRMAGYSVLPISVNLSARQFRSSSLADEIRKLIHEHALDPKVLELELTETTLLIAGNQVMENLCTLKKMGLRLAIDDFGTGYSSLSYLKRMPIDVLKIDRTFVADVATNLDDQAVVSSIVSLGHSLGLEVIAEGVETWEQASFLLSSSCDVAQGFLYAKPMSREDFELRYLRGAPPDAGTENAALEGA